jgi:hyperosmotically inducible periplasmic protein
MKTSHMVPLTVVLLASTLFAQEQVASKIEERIQREVRHELLMLPYYTVFDDLAYEIHGYDVKLRGEVTQPVLKTDAENAVKRIEGVEHIENDIEVLPPSPMDQRLRLRLYRAIYGYPQLQKYALGVSYRYESS